MPLLASLSTRLENTGNSCAASRRNSSCTEEEEQEEEGTLQGRTGFSSPVKEEEENNDDALEEKEWKEETASGRAALDWSMQTQLNSDWSVPARLNSLLAWQQISSMPAANLAPSPNPEQATSDSNLLQSSRNGSPPIESAAMESNQPLFRKRNPLTSFFHPASICASSPASFRASRDLNYDLPSSSEEQNNGGVLSLDSGRNFSSNRTASSYGAAGSFSSGAHVSKQLLHQPKCLGSELSTMREFRHLLSRPPFTYVSLIRQVRTRLHEWRG
jgi:hypothetical protein